MPDKQCDRTLPVQRRIPGGRLFSRVGKGLRPRIRSTTYEPSGAVERTRQKVRALLLWLQRIYKHASIVRKLSVEDNEDSSCVLPSCHLDRRLLRSLHAP